MELGIPACRAGVYKLTNELLWRACHYSVGGKNARAAEADYRHR